MQRLRHTAVLVKAILRYEVLGQWLLMSHHPESQDSGGKLSLPLS